MVTGTVFLISLQMQALVLLIGSWYLGKYLNSNYAWYVSWHLLLFPLSFVTIFHSFYLFMKKMKNSENAEKAQYNDSDNNRRNDK